MMYPAKITALLMAGMTAACQPSSMADLSERSSAAASNSPQAAASQHKSLDIAAAELSSSKGGLVLLKTLDGASPAAAVVVRRRRTAASSSSGGCSLSIVEEVDGRPAIVASSEHLLVCSHESSADGTRDSITVDMAALGGITVAEQSAKGNSNFKLERHASGEWFVTEVRFNHSENNIETGYVDVVSEAVSYPLDSKRILVSDYAYGKVKHDLVRAIIE